MFPLGVPVPPARAGGNVFEMVCGAEARPQQGKPGLPPVSCALALVLGHHLPVYCGISVKTLCIAKQAIK